MTEYPKRAMVKCDICETGFTEKVWKEVNKYSVSGCCPSCGSPMTSYYFRSSNTMSNPTIKYEGITYEVLQTIQVESDETEEQIISKALENGWVIVSKGREK